MSACQRAARSWWSATQSVRWCAGRRIRGRARGGRVRQRPSWWTAAPTHRPRRGSARLRPRPQRRSGAAIDRALSHRLSCDFALELQDLGGEFLNPDQFVLEHREVVARTRPNACPGASAPAGTRHRSAVESAIWRSRGVTDQSSLTPAEESSKQPGEQRIGRERDGRRLRPGPDTRIGLDTVAGVRPPLAERVGHDVRTAQPVGRRRGTQFDFVVEKRRRRRRGQERGRVTATPRFAGRGRRARAGRRCRGREPSALAGRRGRRGPGGGGTVGVVYWQLIRNRPTHNSAPCGSGATRIRSPLTTTPRRTDRRPTTRWGW